MPRAAQRDERALRVTLRKAYRPFDLCRDRAQHRALARRRDPREPLERCAPPDVPDREQDLHVGRKDPRAGHGLARLTDEPSIAAAAAS